VKRALTAALVSAATALTLLPATAAAANGVEHLHYAAGPYTVTPGANLILSQIGGVPKPNVNGFMIRMAPNLHFAKADGSCCGGIPRVDVIHLHHGVWLSHAKYAQSEGNGYYGYGPFMATGEEKTVYELPPGYGYPIAGSDSWVLNYMIHNLWPQTRKVYITYDIDFIPDKLPSGAQNPAAVGITPVHPIWMDVEDHHIYPVFDVKRYSGRNGIFTFPDMAKNPVDYSPNGPPLNEFTIDHPGTLVATAGHVHPGGLYTTLDLIRPGAAIAARKAIVGAVPHSVRLFRSFAHYWDKRGPISWDMAMGGTARDWRPRLNAGDVLRVSATYETRRASWYESMGIMVAWEAWDSERGLDPFTGVVDPRAHPSAGTNPFAHAVDQRGYLTHGHLAENSYYGGSSFIGVNPMAWAECARSKVPIVGFRYLPGDFTSHGSLRCIPTVTEGHSLEFVNKDAPQGGTFNPINPNPLYMASIFHTVTSCKNPCNLNYGIAYPLAGGSVQFDSGELGDGTPGVGRLSWSTPANLPPGTYTFFCRIHPWMRGVFRVIQ